MEYKPPFDNTPCKYRYLYCCMNPLSEWSCVRCEDEEKCYMTSFDEKDCKESKIVRISRDLPERLDRVIAMSKLSSIKVEMKK